MKSKAYSYIRFSTSEQELGDSERRQIKRAQDYALQHDLELQDGVFFDKGVSAYKGKNFEQESALKAFINKVEGGDIPHGSYLLLESWDRFSRLPVREVLPKMLELINKGVNIVTLDTNTVHTKDMDDLTLIGSLLYMSRAHDESKRKSERIKASKERNLELARNEGRRLTTICPAWMRPTEHSFELIQERAEIVRQIFDWSIEGYGVYSIARMLNAKGVPPFSPNAREWHYSYAQKILTNPASYGALQPKEGRNKSNGELIQGYYPAVITEAVFWANTHKRKERKIKRDTGVLREGLVTNFFKGLMYCSCGSKMRKIDKRSKKEAATYGNKGIYFGCHARESQAGCTARNPRFHLMNDLLFTSFIEIGIKSFLDNSNDSSKELEQATSNLEGQLLKIQSDIGNLSSMLRETGYKSRSLAKELELLEAQEDELVNQIQDLREQSALVTNDSHDKETTIIMLGRLKQIVSGSDESAKAELALWVKKHVESITVDSDNSLITIRTSTGYEYSLKPYSFNEDGQEWMVMNEENLGHTFTIADNLYPKPRARKVK